MNNPNTKKEEIQEVEPEYPIPLKTKIFNVAVIGVAFWAIMWAFFAYCYPNHRPMIVFLSIFSTTVLSLIAIAFKKPEITGLNGSFNLFFALVLVAFFLAYALNFLKLDDLFRNKDLVLKFQNYVFSLESKNKRADEIIQRLEQIASGTDELREFYTLSIDALSHDRKSIAKLKEISKNPTNRFQAQAARIVAELSATYSYQNYNEDWAKIIGDKTPIASASLSFLIEQFHQQGYNWPNKVQILQYLNAQSRFEMLEKYRFIFEVAKSDSNKIVADYAFFFLKRRDRFQDEESYKLTFEELEQMSFENWCEKYYQYFKQ